MPVALLVLAIGALSGALAADRLLDEPDVGLMTVLWTVGLASAFCAAIYFTASRD
jgi:hypothetical protein